MRGPTRLHLRHLAPALLLWLAGPVPAGAQDSPADPFTPPAAVDPGTPAAGTNASTTRPKPEMYVALFLGRASLDSTSVSATHEGFLGNPTVSVTQQVSFHDSDLFGLRVGVWGRGELRYLGAAAEFASTKAQSDQVNLRVDTMSLVPMIRLPLLPMEQAPDGLIDLYAGVALTKIVGGDCTASFPALGQPVSGSPEGFGVSWLAGISLRLWRALLLVEVRHLSQDVTFTQVFQHGQATLEGQQLVLGAGIRF